jgi:hypothetical protein
MRNISQVVTEHTKLGEVTIVVSVRSPTARPLRRSHGVQQSTVRFNLQLVEQRPSDPGHT